MKGDFYYDNDARKWEEEPDDETIEYDYDEPGEEVDDWY